MRPLALVGPTGVGKTELSVALAEHLGAEIISVDSRQVYRGMDVGTDKVAPELRARIPHHGLDLIDPDERYSAGRFARDARRWVAEIAQRGRVPLLVGGTGFFLRALRRPIFREPRMDEDRRDRLRDWLAARSTAELVRWVALLDPERLEVAEAGGVQRLSRTIEVALLTGRPLSRWHRAAPPAAEPLLLDVVLLQRPRSELDHRIDARAEAMFRGGLLEEVRRLLGQGFTADDPGMTGTGYRQAAGVLKGELEVDEAVERVQAATRQYARRQLTWFRNQLEEPVLALDARLPASHAIDRILRWREGIGDDGEG